MGQLVRAALTAVLVLFAAGVAPAGAVEDAPGQRFHIRPQDLPPPGTTRSASNSPVVVDRPAGATLAVPEGFTATLFAEGLDHPREFAVLPNGDVLVSQPHAGNIILLRDSNGDGRADVQETFAEGFDGPYGLAVQGDQLYLADLRAVWRLPLRPGALKAAGPAEPVTPQGALGSSDGHSSRSLAFHPAGDRFYVGIGSRGNIDVEEEPRATIREFRLDSSGRSSAGRTFASGLRNPVGIAFYPGTTDLYTVVNERDGLGDGLVPDYLTRVQEGGFYGWPYAYIGSNPQPRFAEQRPDLVAATLVPDVLFESHSAPIGLAFYTGTMFPPEYRGNAFVSFRGSWNRSDPTGYKVVRVPFTDGRPAGWYEDFATGFRIGGRRRAQVWGRPTGVAVAADGALLVADDTGSTIWRIAYRR